MFQYEEHKVCGRQALFIKKLWVLNNQNNPQSVLNKQVLPNGCFTIAFIEGAGLEVQLKSGTYVLGKGVYFCGQLTEAISVTILSFTKATMVQLYPWSPVHFTNLDMGLFTDKLVALEQLKLHKNIQIEADYFFCPNNIRSFINRLFIPAFRTTAVTALITQSCQAIQRQQPDFSVQEMCRQLGYSPRHLQKKFRQHVGLSPKAFSVIIRLRKAVDAIAYPPSEALSFTRLALDNHFYDQAHFTNTFQAIVKTSPRKFNVPDYLLAFK